MRLSRSEFLMTLASPLIVSLSRTVSAQARVHAAIWIETIWCGHTTESGEDEIYLLVSWKNSTGSTRSFRWPDASGHLDMNDNGPKQNRDGINIMLWEGDLTDGDTVVVYTAVMEEDGGVPGDLLQTIGGGVASVGGGNPITDVAGGVLAGVGSLLDLANIQDTDDFPGSFAVQLHNSNGHLEQSWKAVERCTSVGVPPDHPEQYKPWQFDLNGDGSLYKVFVRAAPRQD